MLLFQCGRFLFDCYVTTPSTVGLAKEAFCRLFGRGSVASLTRFATLCIERCRVRQAAVACRKPIQIGDNGVLASSFSLFIPCNMGCGERRFNRR